MKYKKIAIIANKDEKAINHARELSQKYGFIYLDESFSNYDFDLILALGGDGLMLHLLHKFLGKDIPIYGINYGSVGFLMNSPSEDLCKAINNAKLENLYPLKMTSIDSDLNKHEYYAINEVSLLRSSSQAAKIKILINNKVRIEELICDGVLVSTPAGSTAYNLSVGGPVIPLKAKILTITPISPFRPKNWKGALISEDSEISFEILKNYKRPVSSTADFFEVKDVAKVNVSIDKGKSSQILFDPNHSLEERIIKEQFM